MIEIKNNTIKKIFNYKGEDNFAFLKNEVFWLNYLKSKWVPELIEVVVGKDNVTLAFSEPELDTLISLEVPTIVAM